MSLYICSSWSISLLIYLVSCYFSSSHFFVDFILVQFYHNIFTAISIVFVIWDDNNFFYCPHTFKIHDTPMEYLLFKKKKLSLLFFILFFFFRYTHTQIFHLCLHVINLNKVFVFSTNKTTLTFYFISFCSPFCPIVLWHNSHVIVSLVQLLGSKSENELHNWAEMAFRWEYKWNSLETSSFLPCPQITLSFLSALPQ